MGDLIPAQHTCDIQLGFGSDFVAAKDNVAKIFEEWRIPGIWFILSAGLSLTGEEDFHGKISIRPGHIAHNMGRIYVLVPFFLVAQHFDVIFRDLDQVLKKSFLPMDINCISVCGDIPAYVPMATLRTSE